MTPTSKQFETGVVRVHGVPGVSGVSGVNVVNYAENLT